MIEKLTARGHRHNIGIHRREVIQAGFSGLLGLGLVEVLNLVTARPAEAGVGRSALGVGTSSKNARGPKAKSVILVFMTGAPAHQDIWDIDVSRPAEYRGDARAMKT